MMLQFLTIDVPVFDVTVFPQIILRGYKSINYRRTLFNSGIAVLEDAHTHTPSKMDPKAQKKVFFKLSVFHHLFSFFYTFS